MKIDLPSTESAIGLEAKLFSIFEVDGGELNNVP